MKLHERIEVCRNEAQAAGLARFFKTGPGQYGEGDRFLGLKVPETRSIVKACWKETDFGEMDLCLRSPWHEVRLAGLLALVEHFSHARKDPAYRRQCVDFYLAHTEGINNWDLVDLSCEYILGKWLLDKDRALLYALAGDDRSLWEQRISIVTTLEFIRNGQQDDTYAIADLFLAKPAPLHDLLQKAVGWLLREAGKRDADRLRAWLEPRCADMPRTLLRYAIEKFPSEERAGWLARKGKAGTTGKTDREKTGGRKRDGEKTDGGATGKVRKPGKG